MIRLLRIWTLVGLLAVAFMAGMVAEQSRKNLPDVQYYIHQVFDYVESLIVYIEKLEFKDFSSLHFWVYRSFVTTPVLDQLSSRVGTDVRPGLDMMETSVKENRQKQSLFVS